MDDELNFDPRETDYLDHIDMDQAINFYELRTQLADLGFNEDMLLNELRSMVTTNNEKLLHDIYTQRGGAPISPYPLERRKIPVTSCTVLMPQWIFPAR